MRLYIGLFCWLCLCSANAQTSFRLPGNAHPTRYELEVTIVPRQAEFRGIVRIQLSMAKPGRILRLNAKGLTIEQASIEAKGSRHPLSTRLVDDEFLELESSVEIPSGPAVVDVAYRGPLSDKANEGLYRKSSGSDWYAFTTFTPIEARRAFPCFDEPAYKAPWRIILHVPASDVAASNAPLRTETMEPGGMKRVEFFETKPLPSEVVAFTVGPFGVLDAGRAGANHVPVRILAPRGRAREAGAAKTATAAIVERLEHYTGTPYPWAKLDHVAVLDMPYGAVENPGLITYRDRALLEAPERDTPERQRSMRATMAHELAHQWFGNLVTQAWWDDAWLSEGFATWLGMKISDMELPDFEHSIASAAGRDRIMKADASPDTRPVRLAMNSRSDMARVYGGIVYGKGAAILNMIEQWLGPEVFRRGLEMYLSAHALGNATTDDLAAALRAASGADVAPVLHSFLDQTGYPAIRTAGACGFEATGAGRWMIPLCLHGDNGATGCTVLSAQQPALSPATCPAWTWPNRGGAGYFRVEIPAQLLETVAGKGWNQLTAPEKLTLLDDTAEMVALDRIDRSAVAKVLPAMARDAEPAVVNAALRIMLSLLAGASGEDREMFDLLAREMLAGSHGRH